MPSEKIQKTLSWLDRNGITYEVFYHPALFTIEECLAYWKDIKATHCKNLFMRNHKGNRLTLSATSATRTSISTPWSICCIRASSHSLRPKGWNAASA